MNEKNETIPAIPDLLLPGTPPNKDQSRRAKAREAKVQAWQLYKMGFSQKSIAKHIKRSRTVVNGYIQAELTRLKQLRENMAEEYVGMELQRLDDIMIKLWPRALQSEDAAIDRVLRIQERRAKYLGLDKPAQSTLDVKGKMSLEQLVVGSELAKTETIPGPTLKLEAKVEKNGDAPDG